MKLRKYTSWLIVLAAGSYAVSKLIPIFQDLSDDPVSLFGVILVILILAFAIWKVVTAE